MAKLAPETYGDQIRFNTNMLEREIKNLKEQVRALNVVNESLRENLNACTSADSQKALIDGNKELLSILKLVINEFRTVTSGRGISIEYLNSLRIAIEYLERIGAA